MRGIVSTGVYIPRQRLERRAIADAHAWALPGLRAQAKGARAFCSWDEDAVTLAVEAGRDCLRATHRAAVRQLRIASTTFPYADLQHGSIVAAALNLRTDLEALDCGSSQRAATSALIDALQSGRPGSTLLIGADAPQARAGSDQEMQYGAAGAAVLIGDGEVQARLLGTRSETAPLIDHFRRRTDPYDYYWEERWIRDEGYLKLVAGNLRALLDEHGVAATQIAHFVLASPLAGVAGAVARKLGISAEGVVDGLASDCGYSGAAHPLLMLAAALERAGPGDRVLVAGFGQGSDALLFEATELVAGSSRCRPVARALARRKTETAYLRMLSSSGQLEYAWGMRSEKDAKTALTQQYRAADQMFGFVGGGCRQCGTAQFPRLGKCVNPACQASNTLDPLPLADEPARVLTFTVDLLQYTPSPPFNFGLVQFDNGARVMMEFVDADPETLAVGLPLRMVFRIKERDGLRHYDRYFWKAAPAAQGEG